MIQFEELVEQMAFIDAEVKIVVNDRDKTFSTLIAQRGGGLVPFFISILGIHARIIDFSKEKMI